MKHMPTVAFLSVPMTISRSRRDRTFHLEGLRPEPGQPGQVVSVHNDVMEPDRHAVSIRGHARLHPREPACCCRAPRM